VKFFNQNARKFITVHNNAVKIWSFDSENKKLTYFNCPLGKIRRLINCVSIDSIDEFAYCGTRQGDVLEVSLRKGIYNRMGPIDKKLGASIN